MKSYFRRLSKKLFVNCTECTKRYDKACEPSNLALIDDTNTEGLGCFHGEPNQQLKTELAQLEYQIKKCRKAGLCN